MYGNNLNKVIAFAISHYPCFHTTMLFRQLLTQVGVGSSLVTALTIVTTAEPSQALTWTLNNAFVNGTTPVTGSFVITNESANPPILTVSNITVGGITFTEADVITPLESPLAAIDWFQGLDTLSLSFENALTPSGGTVNLDILSDFNGETISGEVVADVVPEPLTLLGAATAIAFGASFKRKHQG